MTGMLTCFADLWNLLGGMRHHDRAGHPLVQPFSGEQDTVAAALHNLQRYHDDRARCTRILGDVQTEL